MVGYLGIVLIAVMCSKVKPLQLVTLKVSQMSDSTNETADAGDIEHGLNVLTKGNVLSDTYVQNVQHHTNTQNNTNRNVDYLDAIQLGTHVKNGKYKQLNTGRAITLTENDATSLNQTSSQNISDVVEDFAETTLSPELPTTAPGTTKATAPDVPYVITNTDAHRIVLTNDHHPNYRRPFKHHLQLGTCLSNDLLYYKKKVNNKV